MKIILLENVRKVGQKGEIVEVSKGYGINFLIKTGKGKLAVGGNLKIAKKKIQQKENKKELEKKN